MKIKKIIAPTMKDALRQIKLELGDDAIILKSRKVNKSGLFSFLSREQIEVTAAVDHQAPDKSPLKKGLPAATAFSSTIFATKFSASTAL